MRRLLWLSGIALLAAWLPACSTQNAQDADKAPAAAAADQAADSAAAAAKLKTQKDKVSYIFGLNIGRNLQQQEVEVNPDILARGLRDSAPGAKTLMTEEEMTATMQAFQKEMMAKEEAQIKELSEKNKKAGAEFLAKNATEPGVNVTESGLQYKIIKEGTGPSPKPTDTVKVIYSGKLLDGREFGSSEGETVSIPLEHVFPGWAEGLQLMKVGGQTTLWIPGELAYQDFAPMGMEPYATLVMDVTLVDIVKEEPAQEGDAAEEKTETPAAPEAAVPDVAE